MTRYRDALHHLIEIRPVVGGGYCAKRMKRSHAGGGSGCSWAYWNFEKTFSRDRAEAQRRLDALAAEKGLAKEETL